MIGAVQFYTGVPAALVAVHVAFAAACTAATGLYSGRPCGRESAEPQPLQG